MRTAAARRWPSRARSKYSSERDQLRRIAAAVTNVWGTELGTTLLNGLKGTTDGSAYFRRLTATLIIPNRRGMREVNKVPLPWSRLSGRGAFEEHAGSC